MNSCMCYIQHVSKFKGSRAMRETLWSVNKVWTSDDGKPCHHQSSLYAGLFTKCTQWLYLWPSVCALGVTSVGSAIILFAWIPRWRSLRSRRDTAGSARNAIRPPAWWVCEYNTTQTHLEFVSSALVSVFGFVLWMANFVAKNLKGMSQTQGLRAESGPPELIPILIKCTVSTKYILIIRQFSCVTLLYFGPWSLTPPI